MGKNKPLWRRGQPPVRTPPPFSLCVPEFLILFFDSFFIPFLRYRTIIQMQNDAIPPENGRERAPAAPGRGGPEGPPSISPVRAQFLFFLLLSSLPQIHDYHLKVIRASSTKKWARTGPCGVEDNHLGGPPSISPVRAPFLCFSFRFY